MTITLEDIADKPYMALANTVEWWAVIANGPFGFRFGPYTDPIEVGKIITEAVNQGVAVTIIANCGTEFDWELANDIAKITSRHDVDGENQSLATYTQIMHQRVNDFAEWMRENHPELTHMDEADWDEQYESWLTLDQSL